MKRRLQCGLICLLSAGLLSLMAGCDVTLPGPVDTLPASYGFGPSVYGIVTDAADGSPIQGARIAVEDGPEPRASATTDASGRYTMMVTGGTMTISAGRSGYQSQSQNITVSGTLNLDFVLAPRVDASE